MRGHYGTHTSVGAAPVFGAGTVGVVALAFIVLGPLLGTAATIALLRGNPATKQSSSSGG